MHWFFKIWIVGAFLLVWSELGFVTAGCAALAAIAGYIAGMERRRC